jgi:hypothetical protein
MDANDPQLQENLENPSCYRKARGGRAHQGERCNGRGSKVAEKCVILHLKGGKIGLGLRIIDCIQGIQTIQGGKIRVVRYTKAGADALKPAEGCQVCEAHAAQSDSSSHLVTPEPLRNEKCKLIRVFNALRVNISGSSSEFHIGLRLLQACKRWTPLTY